MKTGEKIAGAEKLQKQIFDEFEKLFTEGDGVALNFNVLSGEPVNIILLDCLMYVEISWVEMG